MFVITIACDDVCGTVESVVQRVSPLCMFGPGDQIGDAEINGGVFGVRDWFGLLF